MVVGIVAPAVVPSHRGLPENRLRDSPGPTRQCPQWGSIAPETISASREPMSALLRKRTRVQAHGVCREVPLTDISGASFDTFVGAQDEGYNSIPSLAGVFNLCDRRSTPAVD